MQNLVAHKSNRLSNYAHMEVPNLPTSGTLPTVGVLKIKPLGARPKIYRLWKSDSNPSTCLQCDICWSQCTAWLLHSLVTMKLPHFFAIIGLCARVEHTSVIMWLIVAIATNGQVLFIADNGIREQLCRVLWPHQSQY